jgi:hypothetical protein
LVVRGESSSNDPEHRCLIDAARRKDLETGVEFLPPGHTIAVNRFWEFIPYNDDPEEHIPESFTTQVKGHRDLLLSTASQQERNKALAELKTAYDQQFGDSSEDRNAISLFLYTGPLRFKEVGVMCRDPFGDSKYLIPWRCQFLVTEGKWCLLYTGDGYLDTNGRLVRLTRYLGPDRVKRTGIFQVMHHGAENNWHKGVATEFSPIFSIFSSDPTNRKYSHPNAAVLRDFWTHGPIQVDKFDGFTVTAYVFP